MWFYRERQLNEDGTFLRCSFAWAAPRGKDSLPYDVGDWDPIFLETFGTVEGRDTRHPIIIIKEQTCSIPALFPFSKLPSLDHHWRLIGAPELCKKIAQLCH